MLIIGQTLFVFQNFILEIKISRRKPSYHLLKIGDLFLRHNRMKSYALFIPVAVRRWDPLEQALNVANIVPNNSKKASL